MGRDYSLQNKGLARPSTLWSDNRGLDNTGRDSKHVQLLGPNAISIMLLVRAAITVRNPGAPGTIGRLKEPI